LSGAAGYCCRRRTGDGAGSEHGTLRLLSIKEEAVNTSTGDRVYNWTMAMLYQRGAWPGDPAKGHNAFPRQDAVIHGGWDKIRVKGVEPPQYVFKPADWSILFV
jgi:hypothetical protein